MRLTGSRLTLASKCVHWGNDDLVPLPPRDETTEASWGTALHSLVEVHLRSGIAMDNHAALLFLGKCGVSDAGREVVAGWYRAARDFVSELPSHAVTEAPFAYSVTTDSARLLPTTGTRRDYSSCTGDEIATTLDVYWVHVEEDGTRVACVADWETGYQQYKGRVANSLTMALAALCVARAFDCDEARVAFWRVSDDGVAVTSHQIGPDEMYARAFEIAGVFDDLKAGGEPVPGPHCHASYCPARGTCTVAQEALANAEAVQIERVPNELKKWGPRPLDMRAIMSANIRDHDHAKEILVRLKLAKSGIAAIESALREYTKVHGHIPIKKGRHWGRHDVTREDIVVTDDALEIVGRLGDLDELAPRTLAKGRLKKALGKPVFEELMEDLRKAGSTEPTVTVKHEEHKA